MSESATPPQPIRPKFRASARVVARRVSRSSRRNRARRSRGSSRLAPTAAARASPSSRSSSALAYLGVGGKLVAVVARAAADAQRRRRPAGFRRAAGSARPQRRNPRHRHQDHVGVRRTQTHRRQGRGGGAHHRRASRRRRQGAQRAAELEEGLRLDQASCDDEGAAGDLSSRPARRRLCAREQARLSQRADRRPCDRLRRHRQHRHRRHGKVPRRTEPHRSPRRGLHRRSRCAETRASFARPRM